MLKKWLQAELKVIKGFPASVLKSLNAIVQYILDLQVSILTSYVIMTVLALLTVIIQNMIREPKYVESKFFLFGPPAWHLLLVFLRVGIVEEGFFRYLLMDKLFGSFFKWPEWLAVLLSSLLFGAAHLMNPGGWWLRLPQAVAATGVGFYFAYLYKKRGLHFAMLAHALCDFVIVWCVLNGVLR